MSNKTQKISVLEKVGYSLGDFSANLIFQTLMTFLAYFYTDVYKIPANAASAIIFAGGMVGAFSTPIMGIIADRTNTRWGKFRPGSCGLRFLLVYFRYLLSAHQVLDLQAR